MASRESAECKRGKPSVMGKIGFGLGISPWFYVIASLLRLPGFG
jgi:hypothetical protein